MIGSFPIGVVSIGSNYQPGPKVESLGIADATAEGLLLGLLTNPTLDVGSASAQGVDVISLSKPSFGLAGATATGISTFIRIGTFLEKAEALGSANSISGLTISLTQIDSTAQSLNGQMLAKLSLGIGSAFISGISVIPKHIATMIFAHAIASGESLEDLQIRMKIGRADSSAEGLNIQLLSKLLLGISDSQINGLNATTKTILDSIIAESTANARTLDGLNIGLNIGSATAQAEALVSNTKTYIDFGRALTDAQGLNFGGLKIALLGADSISNAKTFGMGVPLITGGISASTLDIVTLIKPSLSIAEMEANAYSFNPITIEILIGDMIAGANLADITYIVNDVPEIVVDRTSTQAVLKVLNQNQNNLRIFRADDHRALFSIIASNHDDSTDYIDSGLDETKNYKYVAAFVVVGEKNGQEYIVTGQRCLPVYTIGNQIL